MVWRAVLVAAVDSQGLEGAALRVMAAVTAPEEQTRLVLQAAVAVLELREQTAMPTAAVPVEQVQVTISPAPQSPTQAVDAAAAFLMVHLTVRVAPVVLAVAGLRQPTEGLAVTVRRTQVAVAVVPAEVLAHLELLMAELAALG